MKYTCGLAIAALTVTFSLLTSGGENTDKKIVFSANAEWKAVDMSDVQIKKGSALDLSSISEPGPAGKHGRMMVSKSGKLAFEDSPDVSRRFFGWNGFFITFRILDHPDKAVVQQRLVKLAELTKRQGYDIVRPLAMDGYLMKDAKADNEFNPDKLDNMDRLIAEFKKNGIYTYLTIAAYCVGRKDRTKAFAERNEDKIKMYLGDPAIRARWKSIADKLLSHVNPYTGIAWKDEPAIACLEFYNEQELGKRVAAVARFPQSTRELLNVKWRAWLLAKYKTADAVAVAWGEKEISTPGAFAGVEAPKDDNGPKANDFSLFISDLSRAGMAWCEGVVRGAGYKGMIAQFNFSKQIADSAVRWETSEMSTINSYTGGPTDGVRPGSKCWQGGSTGLMANYWRSANATQLADRPLMVTETHHYFPNLYQHEEGLIFAPYSALQDFAGIIVHEDPVALEVFDLDHPYDDWNARNPVARANEFISACLYRRGDVKAASRRVELQIPAQFLNTGNHGGKAVSTEQDKIGLMTGFSIAFPDLKRPASLKSAIPKPDIAILPDSGAEVKSGEWAESVAESKNGKFSIQDFVAQMKAKGILPASNLSNPNAGVFQSETGEITMRSHEKIIKVVTPRSEGVSLPAGRVETLACLRVENSTVPAAVAAIAIDGKPLAASSRMVLVYNTEMAFSGMEMMRLAGDWNTMLKQGKMPILMRTGRLTATLKCKDSAKMALYALRINGARGQKLPVSVEDGALKIAIDTATLKDGATPFFELVAE